MVTGEFMLLELRWSAVPRAFGWVSELVGVNYTRSSTGSSTGQSIGQSTGSSRKPLLGLNVDLNFRTLKFGSFKSRIL